MDIVKQEDITDIYLQHLKNYPGGCLLNVNHISGLYTTNNIPDPTCKPEIVDRRVTFNLSLSDFYNCMITKVVNKLTVGCSQEMTD